jgi:acyl-CoA synthetase (NDP forming)
MAHRLDPLLRPRSVAVVGASGNNDAMGEWSLKNLLKGGYEGDIYPVNPKYETVQGVKCYPSLSALPEAPELVVFAVSDRWIEKVLDDAIEVGAKAAVIMSTLYIDDDTSPPLRERIATKIRAAGLVVCGANGMGFYNVRDKVWGCGFDSSDHEGPGNVALISHSGSGMSGLIDCEQRLRVNLAVSTGSELDATMDEYLDFALDLPETRAVGLFVETARNPDGFRAALEKAAAKQIPIVAIKVGRTEKSAQLAVSHSGALAGDDATYEALFDRYGVQRVRDMDELATALVLFAEWPRVGPGGLVTLHDSGGERQLLVDLADESGVALTELGADAVAELESVLDPELPAVNPLDAWSRGGPNSADQMATSLAAMMKDPGTAIGAVVQDRAPYGNIYRGYLEYMQRGHVASGKPVALVAARQGTGHDDVAVTSTADGFPVLDGVATFLRGVRALFDYRDFLARDDGYPPKVEVPAYGIERGEAGALQLLAGCGLPVVPVTIINEESEAVASQYPVVLKTAAPGIAHKSDVGGVVLNIESEELLRAAYRDMHERLGPQALVAPMADEGIEMMLGVRTDPQFGPVVLIGFGGVYAETLKDVTFAMPPFTATYARRCVDRLQLRPLLDGQRGKPPADIDAFCEAAARFSVMVHEISDEIREIDINPIIVHESGCTIVDALIVPVGAARGREELSVGAAHGREEP